MSVDLVPHATDTLAHLLTCAARTLTLLLFHSPDLGFITLAATRSPSAFAFGAEVRTPASLRHGTDEYRAAHLRSVPQSAAPMVTVTPSGANAGTRAIASDTASIPLARPSSTRRETRSAPPSRSLAAVDVSNLYRGTSGLWVPSPVARSGGGAKPRSTSSTLLGAREPRTPVPVGSAVRSQHSAARSVSKRAPLTPMIPTPTDSSLRKMR